MHRSGVAERAIATKEFLTVTADGGIGCIGGIVDIKENHPVSEFHTVRIACAQCAAGRINFSHDMHGRFCSKITEHPFNITCG